MNYLLTFFCFLMIMMPCLFAQERPVKDSSREKDEDIAEKVRDVDDKLSKLLARIDSKQKVQNNPELSPANIENSNGNAQFPEKISISLNPKRNRVSLHGIQIKLKSTMVGIYLS